MLKKNDKVLKNNENLGRTCPYSLKFGFTGVRCGGWMSEETLNLGVQ